MSFADYNEFIQRELIPEMVDTVVYDALEPFISVHGTTAALKGDRITSKYRLAHSSNNAVYDKSDVDPVSSTQTLAKPYWTKLFYHGACEVHGIDLSNDRPGGATQDMIADQIRKETEALMATQVTAVYAQWLADVDSSGTAYSDGSLSRSTYPLLVSYEETTNTAITLAYVRGMIQGVVDGKSVALRDYICYMEQAVYNTFRPLAAAVQTWNGNVKSGRPEDTGYPEVGNFEGLDIINPANIPAMTTGTVFMLRKQDVNIVPHRPLEVEAVESGRDSMKFVLRSGIQSYVDNPYLQGKMLDKD